MTDINPMDLTGKNVMLVGTESETCESLARQLISLGSKLVAVDPDKSKLEELVRVTGSDNFSIYSFNIFDNALIENAISDISNTFGVFDGFVYCAGSGGVKPLSFTNNEFIAGMMNFNLYPFVEIVRCLNKKGRFSEGGSIVALSSISSIKGLKSKTAYSASKAALDASVRCIAAELGSKKIRVNSVMKGWTESDMKRDFISTNMELSEENDVRRQFLGPTSSHELANLIAFLLSDATRTITGTSIVIDGGYTL